MEGFPQLIYDRTEEDLISGNEKGCYGVSDLNRVGQAVTCLANAWNNASYSVQVTTKTNWTVTDFPTASAMSTYLQNIRNLIDAFYRPPDAPPLPGSLAKLTIEKANAIEKNLALLCQLFENMLNHYIYSGTYICGSDLLAG